MAKLSVTEKKNALSAIAKFRSQRHELETMPRDDFDSFYIYKKCINCNVSLYLWATNGQEACNAFTNG